MLHLGRTDLPRSTPGQAHRRRSPRHGRPISSLRLARLAKSPTASRAANTPTSNSLAAATVTSAGSTSTISFAGGAPAATAPSFGTSRSPALLCSHWPLALLGNNGLTLRFGRRRPFRDPPCRHPLPTRHPRDSTQFLNFLGGIVRMANIIKQKWSESSTSLRSRHIVDLALNESDRTPRSSASARIPSPAIPGCVSPHPSPLSFKLSLQFKFPKTVKRPVAYSSVVYRRFEKLAPKIPMSASTCENVYPHYLVHLRLRRNGHFSEKVLAMGENFLCLIDDDAEYRVTSTKKEIQQDLSGDEELLSQVAALVRLMKAHKAPQKTQAMVLTKKLKFQNPTIQMAGSQINLVEEIKVLGLIIDTRLNFRSHVAAVCKKSIEIYKRLACSAKVTWGLNSEIIRIIYTAVIEPIMMYASNAWAPATELEMIRSALSSLQRGFAIKICRAYRTVSLTSAMILAGLLPLDLRIREAEALYKAKKGLSMDYLPPRKELEKDILHAQYIKRKCTPCIELSQWLKPVERKW
ncbi:Retrovirus-related Pol polyprotein from type-1 retrotransposable element R1 4 [Eumeta japonica]|uniref:Retrovirus-related Pol polyprotein from type-1 retrotransposable element R1 4 n=1 Tax=Eumeta variegata TaxID=151549 RepID=A0A4C1ZW27_EUMVA|nr:Retrovirus-related Pol polyprotein from type-1 retrotransposable element R1 4 [Eumeta japonica]